MPRFCTRCGTSNDDEARFCKGCGATLSAPSAGTASASTEAEQAHSGIASGRDGGPMTQAAVQGEDAAPAAVSHAHADQGHGARTDATHPEAQREQARLAEIAARIKAQDKARAAALAAARIPVAADVKRQRRASLLSASMSEEESVSKVRAVNGMGKEAAKSLPAQVVRARAPIQRTHMALPVAGLAALVVAGGAYWWMHTRHTALMHGAAYAPVVAKTPAAPALQETPSDVPATGAVAAGSAPRVAALAPHTAQQAGLVTAADRGRQRADRGAASEAMQREKTVTPRRRADTPSKPEAKSHVVAGRQTRPRQSEGSVQVAKSQQVAQQPSQPVQGLQGRVDALRGAIAACQTKGNFFTQELCIQRVRWKYCGAPLDPDPLWGKTPECPNSQQHRISP